MTDSNKTHNKLHFIGIGGVGMSGLARIASSQGIRCSGSDLKASRFTEQLEKSWIPVSIGQDAKNVPEGDDVTVVVSTAIMDDNPELLEAKRRGLDIIHRAQLLSYLGKDLKTLAVAGTHGKTTTSSMLACVLDDMGLDPTFVIGGMVLAYNTNARPGSGEYYVVEADESDKSLTCLNPHAVIVTSIESDHLDHYKSLDEIYEKFGQFIASVPDGNPAVVCADDKKLVELAKANAQNVVTYGFSEDADVRIVESERVGVGSVFKVQLASGEIIDSAIMKNPGTHNELNATAVLALIEALGLDVKQAAIKLHNFAGVHRRFELVGSANGVTVIDDYAHHPTEIKATIKAAKELDFNNVHVIFQPHRYSRANLFCDVLAKEFSEAFDDADSLIFTNVYAAGETPIPGISGQTFLDTVLTHSGHPDAEYVPRLADVTTHIANKAKSGDLVITMGAGDITEIGPLILDEIKKKN
ncbi:MAG: UDP-N-acetylmuramate--L-alanine ligase [Phoenicibacter congonensis]|uniref:UDP-N-acetylmuramate--L-alanine ligase n=1 Tax=Phoenicibacter congonensis TaxID=1944646 RepID=A0AA43RJ06_9ACTN|nr:UDP-N-acetylmuramate--L-alanine ligase [Phoenicibacter congonensis]